MSFNFYNLQQHTHSSMTPDQVYDIHTNYNTSLQHTQNRIQNTGIDLSSPDSNSNLLCFFSSVFTSRVASNIQLSAKLVVKSSQCVVL
jgi:hypothetical protein